MRKPEQKGDWPVNLEQDSLWLESLKIHLSRSFRDIRWVLTKPYDSKYQKPIEIRLRKSPGKIIAVGLIEDRNGRTSRPMFTRFYDEWHFNRDKAVVLGYQVKAFQDYLVKPKPDEA